MIVDKEDIQKITQLKDLSVHLALMGVRNALIAHIAFNAIKNILCRKESVLIVAQLEHIQITQPATVNPVVQIV